jgi:hypothetical protein
VKVRYPPIGSIEERLGQGPQNREGKTELGLTNATVGVAELDVQAVEL